MPRQTTRRFRRMFVRPLGCERLEDRLTPDAGDTLGSALNTGLVTTGSYAHSEVIGDGLFTTKDVDVYAVTVPIGGRVTIATVATIGGAAVDTYVRVFDAVGTQVSFNDDYGTSLYSRLTVTLPTAGTYYVGVSEYTNRTYTATTGGSGVVGFTGAYTITIREEAAIPWVSQGPGPITGGQVEGLSAQNSPVVGSIEAITPHPTNANILYAGTTNGGVWKTTNALNTSPTWTPLTDFLPSLSMSALEFDRSDATFNTLWAGTGRVSSDASIGGALTGLYKTTDGGTTWTVIGRGTANTLASDTIRGLVAQGNAVVVGTRNNGIYRTIDGGATFSKISGGTGTGLPTGGILDLVADPGTPNRLYTSTGTGFYRSLDGGATWSVQTIPNGYPSSAGNVELAVHNNIANGTNAVYASIVIGGSLNGVFRSADQGSTWAPLGVAGSAESSTTLPITDATNASPILITSVGHGLASNKYVSVASVGGNTAANGIWRVTVTDADHFSLIGSTGNAPYTSGGTFATADGLQPKSTGSEADPPPAGVIKPQEPEPDPLAPGEVEPGGQGNTHFSLAADPTNPNLVYIGGDRQDFPNTIGANNYSGRLFRGDATKVLGSMWTPLTHNFASATSSPHADSRDLDFDANGNLVESDDGGTYRRATPQLVTGAWVSANGNLTITESHSAAYDSLSKVFTIGTQDVGSAVQAVGGATWSTVNQGDGGQTQVAIESANSIRYNSSQYLGGFTRRTYNSAGSFVSSSAVVATVAGLGQTLYTMTDDDVQFYTPFVIPPTDPTRMLLGANLFIYESADRGNNFTRIAPPTGNFGFVRAIAYGGTGNADAIYTTGNNATSEFLVRTVAGGPLIDRSTIYPGNYAARQGIAIDPDDWQTAYVLDLSGVIWRTTDASSTAGNWTNITGNLTTLLGVGRGVTVVDGGATDVLLVSGDNGVFFMNTSTPGVWAELGHSLPNVVAFDPKMYNGTADLLSLGTLGRGVWSVSATSTRFDTTAPMVTSVIRAAASPTAASTAPFFVTFSEPVLGLTASNFAVVQSGLTGAGAITSAIPDATGTVWTVSVATGTGTTSGALELDWTANTSVTDFSGNPLTGGTVTGETYAVNPQIPTVASIVLNNGDIQRSRVTSIAVTFSTLVTAAPLSTVGAFTLTNGTFTLGIGTGLAVAVNNTGPATIATLTFVIGTAGVEFGSLADGVWVLTVDHTHVTGPAGGMVADFVTPSTGPGRITRLFGDNDGDGDVDSIDLARARLTYSQTISANTFNATFDSDGDGDVDVQDFARLRQRFGIFLP